MSDEFKSINDVDANGNNLVMQYFYYSQQLNPSVVTTLVQAGININQKTNWGTTAFLEAARNESVTPDIIDTLVEAGSDPNQKNKEGSNAFIIYIWNTSLQNKQLTL
jgi:ankyrin repeat protein